MSDLDRLTTEQQFELYRFAKQHGRYWRNTLRNQWANSSNPPMVAVRNKIGPRGLRGIRSEELCVVGAKIEHDRAKA
jgi:hypothetical protein